MFGLEARHIEAINTCFTHYQNIEQVVVYGSRAKGNYRKSSDIDLTVIGDLSYSELLKLENELDDLLLPYKIDLSLHRQISNTDLIAHIDRVGKLFYDRTGAFIPNEPPEEYKVNKEE